MKVPAPWATITILQHDGDGGLRMPLGGADVDWNVMPDPDDLARLTGQPRESVLDTGIQELASVAHAGASGLIVEDMIADYRRTRIDE